jgi:hypothetical protein
MTLRKRFRIYLFSNNFHWCIVKIVTFTLLLQHIQT